MRRKNPLITSEAPIETTGQRLGDGALLELVCEAPSARVLRLLVWNGRRSRVMERFEFQGKTYVPPTLTPSILEAVRFPGAAVPYGSVAELLDDILKALVRFTPVPESELRIVPFFALATWFPELANPPTLVLMTPSPAEARLFLRLMRCFCRRGVVVTELSQAGFLTLPMQLQPTLLIDCSRLTPTLGGLLRASSAGGAYVARRGEFIDIRCPKVLHLLKGDVDLSESALRIVVPPLDARSAFLDEREEEALAREFQPRLLDCRIRNLQAVMESSFDTPGLTTGMRQLARTLGAAVFGDPDLQAQLTSLLTRQDEDIRARLTTCPEYSIVSALLALLHEGKEQQMLVSKFTSIVNVVARANGEILTYSPEEIGRRLAAMSFFTGHTNQGNVIRLNRSVSRLTHDLKRQYGITTTPAAFPGCPDCDPLEIPAEDPQHVRE